MFSISAENLNRDQLLGSLSNDQAGAIVVFEGWVRDHNAGKKVASLEYQIYRELALKEGAKILLEAKEKFNLHAIKSVHREGHLQLGDIAIWIGATASHRDDAFRATRYVIDEIKHRLPVWKKEHYVVGPAEWVFCRHHHHHVHFTESDFYKKQANVIEQPKMHSARVLVIGAGGLGCPVLTSLAGAGVGTIGIADFDKIDISNIHRQPLYSSHSVGEKKVVVAANRLRELNPFITINGHDLLVDAQQGKVLFKEYELILDCTDNMQTKYLIHDLCFALDLPLISASIFKLEGQIRTFLPGSDYGCLRCHNDNTPDDSLLGNCNDFGTTGAATSVIGSLQASEALHFLQTGTNSTLEKTLYFNLNNLSQMKIKNSRIPSCETCLGKRKVNSLDFEVLKNDITQDFELVDIRKLQDSEVVSYKSSSKKIALYCHRGVRSKKLVETLRQDGHGHFYSLKGGACSL